jgi:hypothetical protein
MLHPYRWRLTRGAKPLYVPSQRFPLVDEPGRARGNAKGAGISVVGMCVRDRARTGLGRNYVVPVSPPAAPPAPSGDAPRLFAERL